MEQFFAEHFDAIVTLIVGLLGGSALKLTSKKNTNESNKYEHIDTRGGDFVGRDMNKNN